MDDGPPPEALEPVEGAIVEGDVVKEKCEWNGQKATLVRNRKSGQFVKGSKGGALRKGIAEKQRFDQLVRNVRQRWVSEPKIMQLWNSLFRMAENKGNVYPFADQRQAAVYLMNRVYGMPKVHSEIDVNQNVDVNQRIVMAKIAAGLVSQQQGVLKALPHLEADGATEEIADDGGKPAAALPGGSEQGDQRDAG